MKVYGRKEIEERLTEIVNGYIADCYRFNAPTMRGTQGEIGKVDLTNDEMIVRVRMEDESYPTRKIDIIVEGFDYDANVETLWDGKGVELSRETYRLLSNDCNTWRLEGKYVEDKGYDDEIVDKRRARRRANTEYGETWDEIKNFDVKKVLAIVRKMPGLKTVKKSNIGRIIHNYGKNYEIGIVGRNVSRVIVNTKEAYVW